MTEHPLVAAIDLGHLRHTNANGQVNIVSWPGFDNLPEGHPNGLLAQGLLGALFETIEQVHGYAVIPRTEIKARAREMANEKAASQTPTEDGMIVIHQPCGTAIGRIRPRNRNEIHIGRNIWAALETHINGCSR